eukprot:scaffold175590_cov48-Attheya_sp.AAC.1
MGMITRQTRSYPWSGRNNNVRHPGKSRWMKIIKGLVGKRIVALMLASLAILAVVDMRMRRVNDGIMLNVGVPPDLVVHGQRQVYAPVPEPHRGKFYIETKHKGYNDVVRAFYNRGWTLAKSSDDAHIVYQSKNMKNRNYFKNLKPWQRYSRVGGISAFESKDGFFAGFQEYQEKHYPNAPMYFIPKTFLLKEEKHRQAFREELDHHGGMGRPWVLKNVNVNNGQGIEMLGPNSEALKTATERVDVDKNNTYIAQEYICNELVWSGGQKFDLRMFWMVASLDPLIVLYHDGFARVAASAYDETDFSSTGKHLTNHEFRNVDISDSTKDHLWELVRNHSNLNRDKLSKKIRNDPVQHVRNQMKESLGAMVSAFRHVAFANSTVKTKMENLFGFYGCDFLIDNDLDVYFIESQASPGFGTPDDARVDMYREMFRPMIDTVQEINQKQELDARANLLPLQKLGGWEIVYAGDWQFSYKGYERSKHKKS